MSLEETLYELIQKCDIRLNGEVFSKELLLKTYAQFVSKIICSDKHEVGISLHTGSICFDLIVIVYAALSCLLYDQTTPEDIVELLHQGDLIIYNGRTRAVFMGRGENGYARIRQDVVNNGHKSALISTVSPRNFYKIKPYQGDSTTLDGRGIREDTNTRIDFIETVFHKNRTDISGMTHKSVIIVTGREIADLIVRNTVIHYDIDKSIALTELITASYFTENGEYTYLGNPGKTEPDLKFMNRVSLARENIIEDEDERIIGLIILGKQIVDMGKFEITGLMARQSLRYVFTSYAIDCDDNKGFLEEYPDVKLFACTKDLLLSYTVPNSYRSGLVGDLNMQIDNIIDKEIDIIEINSEIDWGIYKKIKKDIHFIKNYEYSDDDTEYFVIHSFSLLNLFSTAVFSIVSIEEAIADGIVGCLSPLEQLNKLEEITKTFEGFLGEKMKAITASLHIMQSNIFSKNLKYELIKDRLINIHTGEYVAIVVPKAFYKTILSNQLLRDGISESQMEIMTAGRLDVRKQYEEIIVVGAFKAKGFNMFFTPSSSHIVCLLYPYEIVLHDVEFRRHKEAEHLYNMYSYIKLDLDVVKSEEKTKFLNEGTNVEEIDSDLSKYIEDITIKSAINHFGNLGEGSDAVLVADIIRVATFQDGEKVFFSKYYTPYVLDQEQSTVIEASVKSLQSGDTLIFTKYTEQTKDIVDEVILKILVSPNTDQHIKEAYRKSKHWKNVLKKHMFDNGLSFKDISKQMSTYGNAKHEATLRSWINEESHIVGPRDVDSFYQIALICEEEEMLADPDSFCEACDMVRSLRIKVLRLIGKSIIRSFQGNQEEFDELFSIVEEKVGELTQVIQVETIADVVDVKVPVYLANRPIQ